MLQITRISRRGLLKAGTLLATGLWPGAMRAADADVKPLRLAVINDLHYTDKQCLPFFARATRLVKEAKPDLCLIVGDLSEHGTAEQIGTIRDLFDAMDLAVYPVVGNHDFPKGGDCKAYQEFYPKCMNYTFDRGGWQFVGFDSCEGEKSSAAVQPAALAFLDETLPTLERKRPLIVFTHFPLGAGVPSRSKNADLVLERFKDFNLRAVFNGHHHGLTERKFGAATVTTNRCCSFRAANHDGSKQRGFFLCTLSGDGVERQFIEVPLSAASA